MDRYDVPFSGARLFTSSLLSKKNSANNNSRSEPSNISIIGQTSGSLQKRSNNPSSGSILRPEPWEVLDKRLSSHAIGKIQISQTGNSDDYLITDRDALVDNSQSSHDRNTVRYPMFSQCTSVTSPIGYREQTNTQQKLVEEEIFRLRTELEAAKNKLVNLSTASNQSSHIWADPPLAKNFAAGISPDMNSIRQNTILSASVRSEGFTDNSSLLSGSIGFSGLQVHAEGNTSHGNWEASNPLNDFSTCQRYNKANSSSFSPSNSV